VSERTQTRLNPGERAQLAKQLRRAYDRGASIREIMIDTGRSYGFVHRLLSEAGATFRPQGGGYRRKATKAKSK